MFVHMKTEFSIYKGDIRFTGDTIKVNDGVFKWHRIMELVYAIVYFALGAYMSVKYFSDHKIQTLLIGIGVILFAVLTLILYSKTSTDTEFDIRQVKKAVISESFSYLNLVLFLTNSRKRKIVLDYRDEDRFSKFCLDNLVETLKSYSIPTKVK